MPPFIRIIAMVGGVLAAIAGVVYAIVVALKVHEFVTTGSQTYDEANHLTSGAGLLALQIVGQLAALLVAMAFVLVSLQAMSQGLLSRFMGYLGIFAGALVLFLITQVPVVQTYWLLAIAYLICGRWPTGVPPAWRTGKAEPWPSSAEMRARERPGRPAPAAGPQPAPVPAAEPEAAAAPARPHPGHHLEAQAQAPQLDPTDSRPRAVAVRRGSRPFGSARPPPISRCAARGIASFRVRLVNSSRRRDGSSQPAVPGGRPRPRVGSDVWPRSHGPRRTRGRWGWPHSPARRSCSA